jgi:LuxR family maltose regulon positive regulatory protein
MGGQLTLKRPKLEDFLSSSMERYPILNVVAGMGYGKSEAIRSALSGMEATVAWLQLTEYDSPARFWNNFTQAMAPYNTPEAIERLRAFGMPEDPARFERYLQFPDAMLVPGRRYIFVYEDLQRLRSPSVLWFIEKSIAMPYQSICSVLLSREEPAFPSLQLSSMASARRIGEEELAFTWEETREFFLLKGLNLPDESLGLIFTETAGCPLALQMACSFPQKNGSFRERQALFAMRTGLEKLFDAEIFSKISPELSLTLEKLALIESPALALLKETGIVNESIGEEMKGLSAVLRQNPYGDSYRVHPLFMRYLRGRKGSLGAQERREIYLSAAGWYRKNDFLYEAVRYFGLGGEYGAMARAIMELTPVLAHRNAEFILEQINQALEGSPKSGFERDLLRLVIRPKMLLCLNRLSEVLSVIRGGIAEYEALSPSEERACILACGYSCLGVIHLLTFEDEGMGLGFSRAVEYLAQCPHYTQFVLHQYVASCASLYINSVRPGCPTGAFERNIEKATPIYDLIEGKMGGYLIRFDDLARCEILFYRGHFEEASQWAMEVAYGTRKSGQHELEVRAMFYLLRIYIACGRASEFNDTLKNWGARYERAELEREHKITELVHAWCYAWLGEMDLVAEWIKKEFQGNEDESNFVSALCVYVKTRLLLAQKNYAALSAYASAKHDDFSIAQYLLGVVDLLAIKAVALFHLGEEEEALAALLEAYELAEPEGIQAPFVELGGLMRALCRRAALRKEIAIPAEWLDLIAKKCSVYAKRAAFVQAAFLREKGEAADAAAALTPREREVLRCLSQGLTREEIAIANHVSLDTVKTEIKSVYAKLHAVNRADAVRIALTGSRLWEE